LENSSLPLNTWGVLQAGYVCKIPGAGSHGEDVSPVTDANGQAIVEVIPGKYGVQASGIPAGGTVMDAGVRTALVTLGSVVHLVFDFNATGHDTAGSGGSAGSPDPTEGTATGLRMP